VTGATWCWERGECAVWLKVEGDNPTGSFKDRGMTVAISVARHEGAQAVVCASTGNTSASMSAYAARAGLTSIVLMPEGKIAAGKMAQAIVHGALIVMVRGNFDHCLDLARTLSWSYPVALVNSVNPVRIPGQKTAAFEIVDFLGDAPDVHLLPVGNAGNITAYWLGQEAHGAARAHTRQPPRGAPVSSRDAAEPPAGAAGCRSAGGAGSRPRGPRRWSPASRSPTPRRGP